MMKKIIVVAICLGVLVTNVNAQKEKETDEKKPFFKLENLFTGGSIGAIFGQGSFSLGLGPYFGYSINKYVDVAAALNYNYISIRDPNSIYKIRQSIIGPSGFVRLYPVKFLFVHGQYEYNFITEKEIPGGGFPNFIEKYNVQSFLVGGGYATGREEPGQPFFFLSILFDVANNERSPYKDRLNRAEAIFRTGVNIPLFQGRSRGSYRKSRDDY
jgi:hypothetical protein